MKLLEEKVGASYRKSAATSSAPALSTPVAPPLEDAKKRITKLLALEPVMLFMKGVPDAPRCGFSRKVGLHVVLSRYIPSLVVRRWSWSHVTNNTAP